MILFKQDYDTVGPEHFDYTTSNRSFLRLYSILSKMGVENNKFHLILYDLELKGIDPHNLKDDSIELKMRITQETKLNPWYAFRSVLRLPEQGSKNGTPFRLNRASLAMIWLYFNHIDLLLVMPRQIGKTFCALAITSLIMYILSTNCDFGMLTKDSTLRKKNIQRLKYIRDLYPEWMIDKQRSDTDNTEAISYSTFNNNLLSFVAQSSEQGAEKIAVGGTMGTLMWDEVAFFKNIRLTYPSVMATTTEACNSAKTNNQPYGNILITTAGHLNTDEGQYVHGLLCNSLTFTERLYDLKSNDELNEVVRSNSPQRMVYCEFSFSQLGKDQKWFDEVTARNAGDENKIARDYLNRWTFGNTASSPIDRAIRDRLFKSKADPLYVQYVDEFMIKWYIPESIVKTPSEFKLIPIVIGMDASENVGRDFTSFIFSDARDMSVIATCVCNTTNIIRVAMFICKIIMNENTIFVPERNSVGCAIVDYCLLRLDQMGINPFFRIYNDVVQEFGVGTNKITRAELSRPGFYDSHRKEFGFRTGTTTRTFLYKTVFRRLLEVACDRIRDIGLINQIGGLSQRNGRIDHAIGGNDDSVIAYILSGYLVLFAENIEMYDFAKNRLDSLLRDLPTTGDVSSANTIDREYTKNLRNEIALLENESKYETNDTLKIRNLYMINQMRSKLPPEEDTPLSDAQSLLQLKQSKQTALPVMDNYAKTRYIGNYFGGF